MCREEDAAPFGDGLNLLHEDRPAGLQTLDDVCVVNNLVKAPECLAGMGRNGLVGDFQRAGHARTHAVRLGDADFHQRVP